MFGRPEQFDEVSDNSYHDKETKMNREESDSDSDQLLEPNTNRAQYSIDSEEDEEEEDEESWFVVSNVIIFK